MEEIYVRSFEKFSQVIIKLIKVTLRSLVEKDYHRGLFKAWVDGLPTWVLLWNAIEDHAHLQRLLTSPSIAGRSELNALTALLFSPRIWDLFHFIFRGLYISTSMSVGNQPP